MSYALRAVSMFYGTKAAERSGVPLINHIHEGLAVLDVLGSAQSTKDAYCLHPLFQADADLVVAASCGDLWSLAPPMGLPAWVMLLVMEYRNQANAWLSDKVQWVGLNGSNIVGAPTPGPLSEVREMLIADKVQNYKDFLLYHRAAHARAAELEVYFRRWHSVLSIDYETVAKKAGLI